MLAYTIWWISGWFRHHSAQETIIVVTVFFVLVGGSFVAAEIRLRRRKRQVDADLKQRLAKLEVILTQPESEWPPDYLEERAIAYARHVLNDKEPNG